jgi:hypothetical protein
MMLKKQITANSFHAAASTAAFTATQQAHVLLTGHEPQPAAALFLDSAW